MQIKKSHRDLFRDRRSSEQRHLPVITIQRRASENFQSKSFQHPITSYYNSVDAKCRGVQPPWAVWHLVAAMVWKSFRDRRTNRIHSCAERILSNEMAGANTPGSCLPHWLSGFSRYLTSLNQSLFQQSNWIKYDREIIIPSAEMWINPCVIYKLIET